MAEIGAVGTYCHWLKQVLYLRLQATPVSSSRGRFRPAAAGTPVAPNAGRGGQSEKAPGLRPGLSFIQRGMPYLPTVACAVSLPIC